MAVAVFSEPTDAKDVTGPSNATGGMPFFQTLYRYDRYRLQSASRITNSQIWISITYLDIVNNRDVMNFNIDYMGGSNGNFRGEAMWLIKSMYNYHIEKYCDTL
jgi:hypothetical protein